MTLASSPASSGGSPPASASGAGALPANAPAPGSGQDPILCSHCGRTASNGLTCQGICVADSGY